MRKKILFHAAPLFLIVGIFGSLCTLFFLYMFRMDQTGAYVTHQHNWSDWGLHIAMVNMFAYKPVGSWFTQHIIYSGERFTYPFLANLLSGILVRMGFSLHDALIYPSIFFSILAVGGVYVFSYLLTKNRSISTIASFLFFSSGGIGFVRFFQGSKESGFIEMLRNLPDFYSSWPQYQWYSGNVISGLFLPQRAFLLGFSCGIWVFIILLMLLKMPIQKRSVKVGLYSIGVLAGLFPIIHMHTFFVLVVFSFFLLLWCMEKWRHFLFFGIPAVLVSSVVYCAFLYGGINAREFFLFDPWYTSEGGLISWLLLWFKLCGLVIPIAITAFFLESAKPFRALLLGACILFLFGNFFLFQPVAWDNSKVFFWCYLLFSIAVAKVLYELWKKKLVWTRCFVLFAFCILTFSGLLDFAKVLQQRIYGFQLNTADDIELGISVRNFTHPDAVFATAAMIHNPIMDWGARSVLMSYWAWAWNYGFDNEQRNNDIQLILSGTEESLALLSKHHVSYVAIGPAEKNDYKANESFFKERFVVAFQNRQYTIYDVRSFTNAP